MIPSGRRTTCAAICRPAAGDRGRFLRRRQPGRPPGRLAVAGQARERRGRLRPCRHRARIERGPVHCHSPAALPGPDPGARDRGAGREAWQSVTDLHRGRVRRRGAVDRAPLDPRHDGRLSGAAEPAARLRQLVPRHWPHADGSAGPAFRVQGRRSDVQACVPGSGCARRRDADRGVVAGRNDVGKADSPVCSRSVQHRPQPNWNWRERRREWRRWENSPNPGSAGAAPGAALRSRTGN